MKQKIEQNGIYDNVSLITCMLIVIEAVLQRFYQDDKTFVVPFALVLISMASGLKMQEKVMNKEYVSSLFERYMLPYFMWCFIQIIVRVCVILFVDRNFIFYDMTTVIRTGIYSMLFASSGQIVLGGMVIESIGLLSVLPILFWTILFSQIILSNVSDRKKRVLFAVLCYALGMLTMAFIRLPFGVQSAMILVAFVILGCELKDVFFDAIKIQKLMLVGITIFFVCVLVHLSLAESSINMIWKDWLLSYFIMAVGGMLVLKFSQKAAEYNISLSLGKEWILILGLSSLLTDEEGIWGRYPVLFENLNIIHIKSVLLGVAIVLPLVLSFLWTRLRNTRECGNTSFTEKGREPILDLVRAVLIIAMIIGHSTIDKGFRDIIFSIHMMAFVLISGYFYHDFKQDDRNISNLFKRIFKLMKSVLGPYLIFVIVRMLLDFDHKNSIMEMSFYGMSYSQQILRNMPSVGPVYFILMLFVVRLIYLVLDYVIQSEIVKSVAVIILALLGICLGKTGYWLPWSADCALVSLIFYHAGFYFKKLKIFEFFRTRKYYYFILVCIWIYMILCGGMELSVRIWPSVGCMVLGCLCGIILLYNLCMELEKYVPFVIKNVLYQIGRNTMYILMVHTILLGPLGREIELRLKLPTADCSNVILALLIQLVLAWLISKFAGLIRKGMKRINS